jgi:two-component system sensor histidine kinase BaeS
MKLLTIRSKLTITFIFISLIGIITITLLSYLMTNEEVRNYVINEARQEYIDRLVTSYAENESWENIDPMGMEVPSSTSSSETTDGSANLSESVLVVDMNGDVVFPLPEDLENDIVLMQDDFEDATPIFYEDKQIGYLVTFNHDLKEEFQDPTFLHRINQYTLVGGVFAIVIALVLGIIASDWISRPIRRLTNAVNTARQGDLSVRVEVDSKDEFGELAESFNDMNAELERLIKARRQLTADIAHELRTPISIILSYSEGVRDNVIPLNQENCQIIQDETLRLSRLIEDLNTLSRTESGELPMDKEIVDASTILEGLNLEKIPAFKQKNLHMSVNIPEGCPKVYADSGRISQVIRNLITNAARYSDQEGTIEVSVKWSKESFVEFSVSDEGPGVPEDALEMIFQRCYRLDASRQRGTEGSGLGLSIARSIIERHNGKIWAENNPDGGLRVKFTLPVSP